MTQLLPGTEIRARSLRWEVILSRRLGLQTLCRLRGLEDAVQDQEIDLLRPLEPVEPVIHALQPEKAAPLPNPLVYHQIFVLEQALGAEATETCIKKRASYWGHSSFVLDTHTLHTRGAFPWLERKF
jgi:hypothetical protein